MASPGKILVIDDHPLVRQGLDLVIRTYFPHLTPDMAGSIAEAEQIGDHHHYRLVLLDLMLPDARGFSGFLRLQHRFSRVPIAIISGKHDSETVAVARALGAAAFLSKGDPIEKMHLAFEAVLEGRTVFPQVELVGQAETARQRLAALSGAQLRVLLALADGRLNKQIAGDLDITEATVKAHMTSIFRKLRVNNRTQAILATRPLLGEQGNNALN